MRHYPIHLYPRGIESITDSFPKIEYPPRPESLRLPSSPRPPGSEPQTVEWESLLPKLLVIAFCGYGLTLLAGIFGKFGSTLALLILTTVILRREVISFSESQKKSHSERLRGWMSYKEIYQKLVQEYELEIERLEKNHQMEQGQYKKKCKKLEDESRLPNNVQAHRKAKVFDLLQNACFDGRNSQSKEGRYEKRLKNELDILFPEKIFTGLFLSIPGYEHPYSPDIAYVDDDINLHIDIEIDEPYSLSSGKPCHYIGKDDDRNSFFLERYWLVVRFSEEQVICHTLSCCKFIAKVIADLTGDSCVLDELSEVMDLPKIRQWSEEEAEDMALSKYRDHYNCLPLG